MICAPVASASCHDELAADDERLLVGQREVDPLAERRDGRPEAGRADERVEDEVGAGLEHEPHEPLGPDEHLAVGPRLRPRARPRRRRRARCGRRRAPRPARRAPPTSAPRSGRRARARRSARRCRAPACRSSRSSRGRGGGGARGPVLHPERHAPVAWLMRFLRFRVQSKRPKRRAAGVGAPAALPPRSRLSASAPCPRRRVVRERRRDRRGRGPTGGNCGPRGDGSRTSSTASNAPAFGNLRQTRNEVRSTGLSLAERSGAAWAAVVTHRARRA